MLKKIISNSNRSGLQKLMKYLRHQWSIWYLKNFNSVVRKQLRDPLSIPVVIISFNQLKYLKELVSFLLNIGVKNVIILDNDSSYPPLLEYFESIQNDLTIIRKNSNKGHLSFWKNRDVYRAYSKGYYVVTDADVVPLKSCPKDVLNHLRNLLDTAFDRTKVGLSLKIDDIPDTNPNKSEIIQWENKYWKSKIDNGVFKAEVDTTFAMYRPKYDYRLKHFTKAWRTDFPYQAKHGGWYLDVNSLSEEQRFYMETANESASWQIDDKGELKNKIHKPLYSNE